MNWQQGLVAVAGIGVCGMVAGIFFCGWPKLFTTTVNVHFHVQGEMDVGSMMGDMLARVVSESESDEE